MQQNPTPRYLTRAEASAYLMQQFGIRRSTATLATFATKGGGPAFRKAGSRNVIYDASELDRWAETIRSEPMTSTSQAA